MGITKIKSDDQAIPEIDLLRADLLALQRDVAAILGHVKANAASIGPAASGRLADRVSRVYEDLSLRGDRAVKSVGGRIEQRPFASLLIAFSAGLVLSRVLSR